MFGGAELEAHTFIQAGRHYFTPPTTRKKNEVKNAIKSERLLFNFLPRLLFAVDIYLQSVRCLPTAAPPHRR